MAPSTRANWWFVEGGGGGKPLAAQQYHHTLTRTGATQLRREWW